MTRSLSLLSGMLLVACNPSGMSMQTPVSDTAPASYRTNPSPKEGYRIHITIKDAPGPFAWKQALAQYDVVNKECLRPPRDNPGGRSAPVPTEDIEIPLTQLSENEYEAVVFADQMLDEDYTGRGVCHWELIQFRIRMKASGGARETRFVPAIPNFKLLNEQTETVFFNKASYPRRDSSELEEPLSLGLSDRSRFGPSITDDDLFTVTFEPKKEAMP
ncbi:hypothetical protein [Luteimonas sp. e5]